MEGDYGRIDQARYPQTPRLKAFAHSTTSAETSQQQVDRHIAERSAVAHALSQPQIAAETLCDDNP
ncbi:hypothetical protein GCM10022419_059690 [Nonomuraea rosea]|uniref:Uncharacterized protein n=1 Tax=Nonomuraea rosea TaxID=638574 RepID=A0ABP6XSX4_9ACTN